MVGRVQLFKKKCLKSFEYLQWQGFFFFLMIFFFTFNLYMTNPDLSSSLENPGHEVRMR